MAGFKLKLYFWFIKKKAHVRKCMRFSRKKGYLFKPKNSCFHTQKGRIWGKNFSFRVWNFYWGTHIWPRFIESVDTGGIIKLIVQHRGMSAPYTHNWLAFLRKKYYGSEKKMSWTKWKKISLARACDKKSWTSVD